MSTLDHNFDLNGAGVGSNLPLRRASHHYDQPLGALYPRAFSVGTSSSYGTYGHAVYLRTPHLPVLMVQEPYFDSADNRRTGGSGTLTRRQFYVIKRGQPLMATTSREASIGVFLSGGTVATRTYANPDNFARRPEVTGYTKGVTEYYNLKTGHTAAVGAPTRITPAAWGALPTTTSADTTEQSDYEADTTITPAEFRALSQAAQADYRAIVAVSADTNDKIPTGGTDEMAATEAALFGSTSLVRYVSVDAGNYYFNAASRSDGFIAPSTGGVPRTIFYDEVDREARVTLPANPADGDVAKVVTPIGSVTNVAMANVANFRNSAAILPAQTTVGFAHTDLEQTTNLQFHQFSTGTEVRSVVRKAKQVIPFVNIVKLKEVLEAKAPSETFNFTNTAGGRSGLKLGLYSTVGADGLNSGSTNLGYQNLYSLLSAADSGYANVHHNYALPFVTTRTPLRHRDKLVPDIFGNFTKAGDIVVASDTNDFGNITQATEKAAAAAIQAQHIVGSVTAVYDKPRRFSAGGRDINPLFESRYATSTRNHLNEAGRRVYGSDTAGIEPELADFIFMALGGTNANYFGGVYQSWGSAPRDIARIAEEMIYEGVFGLVEFFGDLISE